MRWGRALLFFLLAASAWAVQPEPRLKFYAYELPFLLEHCVRDPKCLGEGESARVLRALHALVQRPGYDLYARLRFVSDEREAARYFDLEGQGCRRSASTENHPNALVHFYLPHLRQADPYELFGLLVHEVGHHTGEQDHALLDAVGARLRDFLARQSLRRIQVGEAGAEVWLLNPLRHPFGQAEASQSPDLAAEAHSRPRVWLLRDDHAFTLQMSFDDALGEAKPASGEWLLPRLASVRSLEVEWNRGNSRTLILRAWWELLLRQTQTARLHPWMMESQHSYVIEGLRFEQAAEIKNMQPLGSSEQRKVGAPPETLDYESRALSPLITQSGPLFKEWRIELEVSTEQVGEAHAGAWDKEPECLAAFSAEGLNDAVGNPIPLEFKSVAIKTLERGRYKVVLKQDFPWGLQPAVRRLYLSRLELLFARPTQSEETKFARVLLPERVPEYWVSHPQPGNGGFAAQTMNDPVGRALGDNGVRYSFAHPSSAPAKSGRYILLGVGRQGAKRMINKTFAGSINPAPKVVRWQPAFDGRQLNIEIDFQRLSDIRVEGQEPAFLEFGKIEIVTEDLRYFRWPRVHHIELNPGCQVRLDPKVVSL